MLVKFTKMHALGNDFVVLDLITQRVFLNEHQIRRIADRHRGVGCDQVLLVEPPYTPQSDFFYRIYNQDGSEAEQCGNGARCFARFVRDHGLSDKRRLTLETRSGPIQAHLKGERDFRVNLGQPRFEPELIPFKTDQYEDEYELEILGQPHRFSAVSMGNPHVVVETESLERDYDHIKAKRLSQHVRFPSGANVGFMEVQNPGEITLRVYERGAGETQACGSGAAAAVAVGQKRARLGDTVLVNLPGGQLEVERDQDAHLWLSGPTETVFHGRFRI